MLPYERQSKLLELFQSGGVVSPEDIMQRFGVSIATARRDLKCLEDQHYIKKVYGGAVLVDPSEDAPLKERMTLHQEQKDAIGRACAEMVSNGDFIILDCGTTPPYIAKHLKEKRNLTVLTNSILVINELINTDVSLIILGGQLRKGELSIVGSSVLNMLEKYQVAKCFISASGVNIAYGVSDFVQDEIEVKKKAIKRSRQAIIVADSSKFNFAAPRHLCAFEEADVIITDSLLPPDTVSEFRAAGCNLMLAK